MKFAILNRDKSVKLLFLLEQKAMGVQKLTTVMVRLLKL